MNKQTTPLVSVVIPCYNEQDTIGACLAALAAQSTPPLEVLVIDNNCTDQTVAIAKKYRAKIIKENKQGVIYARNLGLNAAVGQIIARLDADSLPAADWIAKIELIFQDYTIQAVTGTGYFYDAPARKLTKIYRNFFAVWLNRFVLGHHMLWGSNMAFRASAWNKIRNKCCDIPNIMEDLDLAAHIFESYGRGSILYSASLRVDISARRAMVSMRMNWLYLKMWPITLKRHDYERRDILWPVIAILLITMSFGNKISRFYNHEQRRMIFSLTQWRNKTSYERGNP